MRDEARNGGTLRSAFAATSLALLVSASSLLPFFAARRFVPRNVVGGLFPDNPLGGMLLEIVAAFAAVIMAVACCLLGILIGGTVWLILMKPFFAQSELRIFLGLQLGKPSSAKRLVTRVVDLIY